MGSTMEGGHYYSFIKNSNQLWYRFDDCSVRWLAVSSVLSCLAPSLFFLVDAHSGHTIFLPPSSSSSLCTNCLPTPTLARAWRMACLHALDRHCKIALRRMSDSSRRSADRITSERRKDSALLPLCNKHVSGSAQRSMPSTVHSQRFVAALPMASLQLHRNGLNAPSLLPTCLTTLTTATTTATSPHNVSNCFLPPPLRSRPPICCCALRTGGLVCAPHQVCGRSRSNGEQFTQL